jgi:3-dehydroquinate synthase
VRALLNLGHTFGHAIENGMGYGVWLHGEAVATGMVMAADLSARLGYITWQEAARAKALIERAGLPVVPPEQMSAQDFLKLMSFDKKVQGGKIRFILMQGLGGSVIESNIDASMLEQTLEAKEQLCQH